LNLNRNRVSLGIRCRWGIRNALFYVAKDLSGDDKDRVLGIAMVCTYSCYYPRIKCFVELWLLGLGSARVCGTWNNSDFKIQWMPPRPSELKETWGEWLEGWKLWWQQVGMNVWYGRGGLNVKVREFHCRETSRGGIKANEKVFVTLLRTV